MPRVPKRYQAEFKSDWDRVQYAEGHAQALAAYNFLKSRWGNVCGEAVECMGKDIETLLVHFEFPQEHWNALRTTNPIERVNKEFKRRSKAMEVVSPNLLKGLLAFTALRLEYGWVTTPITSAKLQNFPQQKRSAENQLKMVEERLLN